MINRFVEKLGGFVALSQADVAALQAATSSPRQHGPRQDLIRERDQPGPVIVVLEGWACRYKILPNGGRQIMAFLMPGDCCDLHNSMLTEMDHSIQTLTPAIVSMIPRAEMDVLMERPNIARALYTALLVDESTLRSWIVSMGRRSSLERVAHLMCELCLRAYAVGDASDRQIVLPFSQIVMSDALGMTPVHINRILKELRLAGAMDIRRGKLAIMDPIKLVHLAGFDENYLHRRLAQQGKGLDSAH
jgi:CRP-like cAMP-binding protein